VQREKGEGGGSHTAVSLIQGGHSERNSAWWTTVHAICCRCMDPPEACRCEPTSDPAEGCFALALDVPEVEREGDECD